MPVSEMLDRMSALELSEWAAYERDTGPIGQGRDDRLAAMTAFYVVSALGAKDPKLERMVPKWSSKRAGPESSESMSLKLRALTASAGGEIIEAA